MPSPDADTDELLLRLRKHADGPVYVSEPSWWQERRETLQQAAAEIERLRAALRYGVECRHPVLRSWRISGGENATPNLREFEVQARAVLGMPPRPDPFPKFSADDFDAVLEIARNPTTEREGR